MKKKSIVSVFIIMLGIIAFAFFSSEIGSEFLSNYSTNFKKNVNFILKHFNISVSEDFQKFLDDVPQEETQPKTEYDILKQEYEKQQKEEEEAIDKQKESDNNEYESTNISYTGKNIAFENANFAKYSRFNSGILSASETQLTYYSTKGEKKWSVPIQFSSPILKTSKNYILLFEKNGSKFSVYNNSKILYSKTANGKIKTASVSSSGDTVIVFDRETYKGSVSVYNKSGDEVYLWNSGKYNVIDADISPSRRLAVALLDPSADISSKIYFFDISKSDVDASVDIDGSVVFDVIFDGDILNTFTDDKILGISQNAKIKWTYDATNKNITKYSISDGGTKVIAYDNNNSSEITLVSSGGHEKKLIKSDVLPDFVDISNDRLLYNDSRTLIFTSTSGTVLSKYTASRDIKKAYIINSDNIFIVYNSSIEFLNTKGA